MYKVGLSYSINSYYYIYGGTIEGWLWLHVQKEQFSAYNRWMQAAHFDVNRLRKT